jgi:hypothetical protein
MDCWMRPISIRSIPEPMIMLCIKLQHSAFIVFAGIPGPRFPQWLRARQTVANADPITSARCGRPLGGIDVSKPGKSRATPAHS